jgi:hypothetical protein
VDVQLVIGAGAVGTAANHLDERRHGPDPLWLRGQGQAEAVGGDRTATTPTTTATSHEPPDKDDNTTFTRHLAGASRQIDTTVPMGRTSAHSSPRRGARSVAESPSHLA